MTIYRILIAEGNDNEDQARLKKVNGCAPSDWFDRVLRSNRSNVNTEIFFPTVPGARPLEPLETYDGILITGSNSSIYKREPSTMRQIEFAQAGFWSGTPMMGVCWGLQLGIVATGGDVQPIQTTDFSCEAPFCNDIKLTEVGKDHPLHALRPERFDAFAFHSDQVVKLSDNATVTAKNRHFIQGVEIREGLSVFWGVQYHPELDGRQMAGFLRAEAKGLLQLGAFNSEDEVHQIAVACEAFRPGGRPQPLFANWLSSVDPADFEFRPIEVLNWFDNLVVPTSQAE